MGGPWGRGGFALTRYRLHRQEQWGPTVRSRGLGGRRGANWVIWGWVAQRPKNVNISPIEVSRVSICPRRTVCKVRSSVLHSLHLYHPESPVVHSMCISPHTCALHTTPSKIYILHRNQLCHSGAFTVAIVSFCSRSFTQNAPPISCRIEIWRLGEALVRTQQVSERRQENFGSVGGIPTAAGNFGSVDRGPSLHVFRHYGPPFSQNNRQTPRASLI